MFYATATASGLRAPDPSSYRPYEFPLSQLWLAGSTDAGRTWTNRMVLDVSRDFGTPGQSGSIAHLLPAAAVDHAGNVYVVLSVRTDPSPQTHLFVLHSTDRGSTWTRPSRVDAGSGSNVMPAVAAGPDGALFVSWYGSPAADFRDPAASWTEMFAQGANPLAAVPAFASGPVGGPNPVHLGGIDTAGAVGSDVGANWGLRDFQGITVDSCGRPHLAWAVDHGGNRTVTATTTAECTFSPSRVPTTDAGLPPTGRGPSGGPVALVPVALAALLLVLVRIAMGGPSLAPKRLRENVRRVSGTR